MSQIEFTSQIGQDKFVLEQLGNIQNGTFVDVGAHQPVYLSNTYYLEKALNWRGIAVDIESTYQQSWIDNRPNSKFILSNALHVNWEEVFVENNMPTTIDYLTIDLEPPTVTMQGLFSLPFDKYTFKVITFETDYYRDQTTQEPSRRFLQDRGYVLVKAVNNQDDWYVHNSVIRI